MELFLDKVTADIANGISSKQTRKRLPSHLLETAQRKVDMLLHAADLQSLKIPPSNHLERLKDDRKGQWSIRINDTYRICFKWTDQGVREIEIVDYH